MEIRGNFIASLVKYKYPTEVHEIIESPKPHVMSHAGLTRQSWGADVIKSRRLVETPVPAGQALSESWSFVGSGPGDAGPDRSRSQDITPSRDQRKPR